MKFKNYLAMLFHVAVTTAIVLSLPTISCIIFYNVLPNWATVVIGLTSAIPTIYWGMKYLFKIVDKFDFFD